MMSDLIETYPLKTVELEHVANSLNRHLAEYFEKVSVSVTKCPDLSMAPTYNLATTGIGGFGSVLVDIGGPPYLAPLVNRKKIYDLAELIPKHVGTEHFPEGWYACGAAAGPWISQGSNCEMVVNLQIDKEGNVQTNKSKVALTSFGNGDDIEVRKLPNLEARCAVLANIFVSGGTGKVLDIKCTNRIDSSKNFTSAIRDALKKGFDEQVIAMGGLFMVKNSDTKIHIMRDFSETPLETDEDVNKWLKFFHIKPPMLFQSILVSSDPGLDLRIDHSHGWNLHGDAAGHYHCDDMPSSVEYHGIYALAEKIIRIDRPPSTTNLARN